MCGLGKDEDICPGLSGSRDTHKDTHRLTHTHTSHMSSCETLRLLGDECLVDAVFNYHCIEVEYSTI